MIEAFALWLALVPQMTRPPLDESVERDFISRAAQLAYGELSDRGDRELSAWPVKVLSIGHTMASYQNYGFSESDAYFHHGIDIRAAAESDVLASRGGKVVNIENYISGNPQYWEVAILDDEGFLWQYHHVDRKNIPQAVIAAYESGEPINAGTKIGTVVPWTVSTFGETFHHIHLNILGKNREYLNPFAFLESLHDVQGPQIVELALTKNGQKVTGTEISGTYSLMLYATDLILHNKFVLPPNRIQMEVDGKIPVTVWEFTRLPGGSSNTAYVNQFFVPSQVCGNYDCRKPVMNLGFSMLEAQVFPLNTGTHHVRVFVDDFVGNRSEKEFSWKVSLTFSAEKGSDILRGVD